MICAGIDAGSRTLKAVLLDARSGEVVASGVVDQGVEQAALARKLLTDLTAENGIGRKEIKHVVATGYGRKLIAEADRTITEITCQAAGIARLVPGARTVIDIGGQDSKLLRLDASGHVHDFVMNDRCAAGTGRFLEVVAARLGERLARLGQLAAQSQTPAKISNMCVVFAETEIVGLLAQGATSEDIVAGVQASIATRVVAMGGGRIAAPIVFTGGVALVPGMDAALADALNQDVAVAPDPQLTCALGAAILAANGKATS
ncbi:MAG: 2-hydroxyglutaryl-CoA dehydratase [Pirellulales bacterium]|nr:2-hydroxyglutaryl-CoA dehydratase [Pirellulales bacterium]